MTYPNESVAKRLSEEFVPAKVESARNADLARKLGIRWLPGLVVTDEHERPAHAVVGFLPPEDLHVELTFAQAILAMGQKRYDDADALFRKVAESDAERAPEAAYWWGVSRYRQTKNFFPAIDEPWGLLRRRWPASQWARKVGYTDKYRK